MPKQHVSTSPRTPWSPNRTNVDFRVTTSKDLLAWHVWIHNDKSRFDGPHMLFIFCFEGSYLMLMCDLDWGLLQSACVGANQQSALFFSKKLSSNLTRLFPHSSQPCPSIWWLQSKTSLLGCHGTATEPVMSTAVCQSCWRVSWAYSPVEVMPRGRCGS